VLWEVGECAASELGVGFKAEVLDDAGQACKVRSFGRSAANRDGVLYLVFYSVLSVDNLVDSAIHIII
jgi:hypothetical protein